MRINCWLPLFLTGLLAACAESSGTDLPHPDASESLCGDGRVEGSEQCDDGNLEDGDGCSSNCELDEELCIEGSAQACPDGEICREGRCAPIECVRDEDCDAPDECALEIVCDASRKECVALPALEDGEACLHESGAIAICIGGRCTPRACDDDAECDNQIACDGAERCVGGQCFASDPLPDGAFCWDDGVCLGGACVVRGCESDWDCASDNECREDGSCDRLTFQCVLGKPLVGAPCAEGRCDPSGECAAPGCGNGLLEDGEQCDDWNQRNGDGCSSRCRIETAFRIQNLELVDPHFFSFSHISGSYRMAVGACRDFTNQPHQITLPEILGMPPIPIPAVNDLIGATLQPDESGAIALSALLVVDSIGEKMDGLPFSVQSASCESVHGGCGARELLLETSYNDGTCLEALPETMSATWGASLHEPEENCFRSDEASIVLSIAGLELRLSDAVFAGEWDEDELGIPSIGSGVIRGFLKESDADATNLIDALDVDSVEGLLSLSTFLPGGTTSTVKARLGPISLDILFDSCFAEPEGPPHHGKDASGGESGWWFYLNYDASATSD